MQCVTTAAGGQSCVSYQNDRKLHNRAPSKNKKCAKSRSPQVPSERTWPENLPSQPGGNGSLDYPAGADSRPAARYPIAMPERLDFPADTGRRWAQITFGRQQSSMQRSSKAGGSEEPGNARGRSVALPWGLRPNPDVGLPRDSSNLTWPRISLRPTADLTEQTADFGRPPPIANEIVAQWGTRHTIRTGDIRTPGESGWLPACKRRAPVLAPPESCSRLGRAQTDWG